MRDTAEVVEEYAEEVVRVARDCVTQEESIIAV